MGRGSDWTFFQRRHTNCQQAHEKMFNITNYKRNTNQNYNEILSKRQEIAGVVKM